MIQKNRKLKIVPSYKSSLKTIEELKKSFLKELKAKGIKKIKLKNVLVNIDYDKSSFYRYFNNVYEIMQDIEIDYLELFENRKTDILNYLYSNKGNVLFLDINKNFENIYLLLTSNPLYEKKLKETLSTFYKRQALENMYGYPELKEQIFGDIFYSVMIKYYKNKKTMNFEEVLKIFKTIIEK